MTHGYCEKTKDIENTRDAGAVGIEPTALFGGFCTLLHDFPEPEGIVWFTGRPRPGQRFKLPSSKFTDEWEVQSVNDHYMSFTAVEPND